MDEIDKKLAPAATRPPESESRCLPHANASVPNGDPAPDACRPRPGTARRLRPRLLETLSIQSTTHQSIVGSRTPAGFEAVLNYLIDELILTGKLRKDGSVFADDATLTFKGWHYFDQLHRGAASSRKAFMAMEYGHSIWISAWTGRAMRWRKLGSRSTDLMTCQRLALSMTGYGLKYAHPDFSSLISPMKTLARTGRRGSLKDSGNLSFTPARRGSSIRRRHTVGMTLAA